MERERKYGGLNETGETASTMNQQDERTWSIVSHVSVLVGPVGALLVWLLYKDKSSRVEFHALQSLFNQIAWLAILTVGWTISFMLTFVLIGFLLMPVMALVSLVPFIHGCYAAYKVSQGVEYRYPYVADKIDDGRVV